MSFIYDYDALMDRFKYASVDELLNDETRDLIFRVFPEAAIMYQYDQKSHAHQYDLWEHSIRTVCSLDHNNRINDPCLVLAAFFHDIGKPGSRTADRKGRTDENGELNHFHYLEHAKESVKIVTRIISRINDYVGYCPLISEFYKNRLCNYVKHHDTHLHKKHDICNVKTFYTLWTYCFDYTTALRLIDLEHADAVNHIPTAHSKIQERIDITDRTLRYFDNNPYMKVRKEQLSALFNMFPKFYNDNNLKSSYFSMDVDDAFKELSKTEDWDIAKAIDLIKDKCYY